jgi:hypothetical protein
VKSVDGRTTAEREPDAVSCDAADNAVVSDAADRLRGGCRSVGGWDIADFTMRVRPTVSDGAAAFAVRCGVTEMNPFKDPAGFDQLQGRCRGTIELRGRHGEDYGKTTFGFDSDPGRSTAASVTVPLTPAGRKALRHGALVVVEAGALSSNGWTFTPAGFRAVLGR